jgi:hypothetical protein
MKPVSRPALLVVLALTGVLAAVYTATPAANENTATGGNSYYVFTKALRVDDSGVVAIPPRFKWSVETSWRGEDSQGKDLPDSRVMLRLYDPDHNFTALTAQMDLATAAKLHRELGDIIVKKLQDAEYQHRPRLYDPKDIPTGRFKGIDKNGGAVIEVEDSKTRQAE